MKLAITRVVNFIRLVTRRSEIASRLSHARAPRVFTFLKYRESGHSPLPINRKSTPCTLSLSLSRSPARERRAAAGDGSLIKFKIGGKIRAIKHAVERENDLSPPFAVCLRKTQPLRQTAVAVHSRCTNAPLTTAI